MKSVYLDNAATTPLIPEVVEAMKDALLNSYGNPSSSHQVGRKSKALLESARKSVASKFNVSSKEIIFTSSGTEANNLILYNAVQNYGVKRIITSRIEHHAVLHPCEHYEKQGLIQLDYVDVKEQGQIDLNHLEELLANSDEKTLVSLMLINNEIGNRLPAQAVVDLCGKYKALFHSDTVQVIGHYDLDLLKLPIDFITASAHKFHGPKGVGFAYFKNGFTVKPMLFGGDQEKGARSSTENIPGIVGLEKALNMALENVEKDHEYVEGLKAYFIEELQKLVPEIQFNGQSADVTKSSYTILNVRFPIKNTMFLFQLDMKGVAVSTGSACQSGASKVSHVLQEFLNEDQQLLTSLRFSFSKFTTKEEIDFTLEKIKELL
ncbi:MAG: cysteine desulfurase [Flavobacteriaceae bacterium]|nr:cysteine desulfurase [Flavobacteriaceae bacterium]|tara:strand:- start:69179 stop:70312 length:1134 start_codon:yes stop_codon:yes gene_type:complete